MNNLQLVEKILHYVDENLNKEITFENLAEKFRYSPFHFHRIFTSITGQTITNYIKRRRLTLAHQKLCETNERIADICYETGFNSIQAFNRAFKEAFHMQPSQVRAEKPQITYRSIDTIISGYVKRVNVEGEYAIKPVFIEKDEFYLAGYRKHTRDGIQVIGESWHELKNTMNKLKRVNPSAMYGLEDYTNDFISEPLQFYYMAAVDVEEDTNIPDGMCKIKIPQALYAVFTVNGNNANGEIGKAFKYIYDIWLPNSEYCLDENLLIDFEYYDERWDCQSKSAQLDIYIPVKKLQD